MCFSLRLIKVISSFLLIHDTRPQIFINDIYSDLVHYSTVTCSYEISCELVYFYLPKTEKLKLKCSLLIIIEYLNFQTTQALKTDTTIYAH